MGHPRRRQLLAMLVAGGSLASARLAFGQEPPEEPVGTVLQERAVKHLVQLDVTVSGPPDVVAALTAADFDLAIGGRPIPEFTLDAACGGARGARLVGASPGRDTHGEVSPADVVAHAGPKPTYLFYFDQMHLTLAGRARALDQARELIEDLVVDGARATIVSSAGEVRTYASLGSEPKALLAALDTLEQDRSQWDLFPSQEDDRVREVYEAFGVSSTQALSVARHYQEEEMWRSSKALGRFSMTLGRLADIDPPKIVLYFADTMRSRAGYHYFYLVGNIGHGTRANKNREPDPDPFHEVTKMDMNEIAAFAPYDRVLREAAAYEVRLYTIQAAGLTALSPYGAPASTRSMSGHRLRPALSASTPVSFSKRVSDAQDALAGFALETGGRHFLNGVAASRIARQIAEDMGCVLILSLDAAGLPTGRMLPVSLHVTRPGVTARTRGQILVQGDSERTTSRLMAAFATPDASSETSRFSGSVIPLGFADGKYAVLMQAALPGSPLAGAEWDVGASLISRGAVDQDASSRISVGGGSPTVVFESEMAIRPGPYEIVLVGHETRSDEIVGARLEGSLPDPTEGEATIAGVVLLQPVATVFVREQRVRTSGARAVDVARTPLAAGLQTGVVSLICHEDLAQAAEWRVRRWLEGDTVVEFPARSIDFGMGRCVALEDRIPAGTMGEGSYTYGLEVRRGDEVIARAERAFAVGQPE